MGIGSALYLLSSGVKPENVAAVCKHLDPKWVVEALLATGTASIRKRRFPAEQALWLVIGMALFHGRPIEDVVDKLDLALPGDKKKLGKSSICEARAKLGDDALAWLFSLTAQQWAHRSAAEHTWHGLKLYGADGTTLQVPDSIENREYFGGTTSGRGESGYPLVRLVGLMALRTHLMAAVSFGPYENGEWTLAAELWTHVPEKSLVIVDKGFFGAGILLKLQERGGGRHWLTRAKKGLNWRLVQHLGPGDDIVEMDVSHAARAKNPDLPKTWTARAVWYQRKGFKPQILLTSMVDPVLYPAQELADLYHERWELELANDNVKTHMLERKETLRSKKPAGVSQEILGIMLAHNLVRLEIERVAAINKVEPTRISFTMVHRMICDEWLWCSLTAPGAIPKNIAKLEADIAKFILPRRRERSQLRGVKVKMSAYNRIRPGDRARAKKSGKVP